MENYKSDDSGMPNSVPPRSVTSTSSNTLEESEVVASLPEKPPMIQTHERKVSWSDLVSKMKKERPVLDKSLRSNGKISLSDVIASKPVEQEAQTHIMRAVEKISAGQKNEVPNVDTETDSLLRDIAADEITRSSHEAGADMPDDYDDPINENSSFVAQDSHSMQQPQSQSSLNNKLKAKAKFQRLVKKHMDSNNVEQSLFGLTTALTQMGEDSKKFKKSNVSAESGEFTPSSANRFANAAHTLMHHAKSNSKSNDVEAQLSEHTDRDDSEDTADSSSDSKEIEQSQEGKQRHHHRGFFRDTVTDSVEKNWNQMRQFFSPRKAKAKEYARRMILFVMLPSLAIAAFLFYVVENPTVCEREIPPQEFDINGTTANLVVEPVFDANGTVIGNVTVEEEPEPEIELFVCPGLGASASWWFLFLGVRQVVTYTLALITQMIVIDYLVLNTRFCLSLFGPVITLFFVQAKGWPFILAFWAGYDLLLLAGDSDFVHHWLHFQGWIGLFNEENPSGNVVDNEWNFKILQVAIFVGIAVSLKRLYVALFLGRQTFARYGEQLAEVMKNMVLLGEVATLARDIEHFSGEYANNISALPTTSSSEGNAEKNFWVEAANEDDGQDAVGPTINAAEAANAFMARRNAFEKVSLNGKAQVTGQLSSGGRTASDEEFTRSEQFKLAELLDAWEEPQTAVEKKEKKISIGAVLQFRQALTFMKVRFPFLPAFGPADTREHCIDSAQQVYDRLLLRTPSQGILPFDTLALLAKDHGKKSGLDQDKAKLLIKVFRPHRDGKLSKLDFVKSVDEVYKQIRLLSANIDNSSQIDEAVEGIFNVIFYAILGAIVLSWLGVDPFQLFISMSSVILGFAFMFGSSSAQYFQGILFILVQSPYGVGDRIHFSRPDTATSIDGSAGWIIEKVTLYTTSVYWGATNERATISNGSISNMRVINAARSPNAQLFVNMKFAIDTPYEKIEVFKAAIEQYLKDRPREWLAFVAFRPTEAAVDKSYINYVTIAQHRAAWQDIGAVLQSKADLVTYELEVAKQLDMRYSSPHLPVDLKIDSGQNGEVTPQDIFGGHIKA